MSKSHYAVCLAMPAQSNLLLFLEGSGLSSLNGFGYRLSTPDEQQHIFFVKSLVASLQEGVEVLVTPTIISKLPKCPGDVTIFRYHHYANDNVMEFKYDLSANTQLRPVEDLTGYRVFPRASFQQSKLLIDRIKELNGASEVSKDDFDAAIDWPKRLPGEFTQRKIESVLCCDLEGVLAEYVLNGKVFVKTKFKTAGQGLVISVDELLFHLQKGKLPYMDADVSGRGCVKSRPLSSDVELIVSQPIDFAKPPDGNIFGYEYRVFVVNGHPTHLFRYPVHEDENVPREAKKFASDLAERNRKNLPQNYVVDIGMLTNGSYAVVEVNPISSSLGLNRRGMRGILRRLGYSNCLSSFWKGERFSESCIHNVDKL